MLDELCYRYFVVMALVRNCVGCKLFVFHALLGERLVSWLCAAHIWTRRVGGEGLLDCVSDKLCDFFVREPWCGFQVLIGLVEIFEFEGEGTIEPGKQVADITL